MDGAILGVLQTPATVEVGVGHANSNVRLDDEPRTALGVITQKPRYPVACVVTPLIDAVTGTPKR